MKLQSVNCRETVYIGPGPRENIRVGMEGVTHLFLNQAETVVWVGYKARTGEDIWRGISMSNIRTFDPVEMPAMGSNLPQVERFRADPSVDTSEAKKSRGRQADASGGRAETP